MEGNQNVIFRCEYAVPGILQRSRDLRQPGRGQGRCTRAWKKVSSGWSAGDDRPGKVFLPGPGVVDGTGTDFRTGYSWAKAGIKRHGQV
jgi:hypothetical protein